MVFIEIASKVCLLNKIKELDSGFNFELKNQLLNAAKSLKIIKTSIKLGDFRSRLIENYENLLQVIESGHIFGIEDKLEELGRLTSQSIMIHLVPNQFFSD